MGEFNSIQTILAALVAGNNTRQVVYPVGAPVAIASDNAAAANVWAAYVEIVAAAAIANPCWLVGLTVHTTAVETHTGDIALATGAGGAEVDQAIMHYAAAFVGATANLVAMPMVSATLDVKFPIRVAGAPRLAARIRKSTAASLAGVSVKVVALTGFGT